MDAVVAGIGMLPDTRVAEASGLAVDGVPMGVGPRRSVFDELLVYAALEAAQR